MTNNYMMKPEKMLLSNIIKRLRPFYKMLLLTAIQNIISYIWIKTTHQILLKVHVIF
jgi:hypothetical protein